MDAASEGVNEPGVAERAAQTCPIKAQSTAVARATASICNAEWVRLRGTSGHVGFVHTFSDGQALAALGAARIDHGTATSGLHANEETMGAFAPNYGRLICAFHGRRLCKKING